MSNVPIRFMIVDDHNIVREGMASLLTAFPDLELVAQASSGRAVLELYEQAQPDVVLMDLVMPDVDGVTAIRQIRERYPESKVIALSSFADDKLVSDVLHAGAMGYLLKNVSAFELAQAIRMANAGMSIFAPEIRRSMDRRNLLSNSDQYDLTRRELEVLRYLVQGLSNEKLAAKLNISKFTVKNHVSSILAKLEVSSRAEAVRLAQEQNLVPLD